MTRIFLDIQVMQQLTYRGFIDYVPGVKIPSPSCSPQPMKERIFLKTVFSINTKTEPTSNVNLLN